MFDDINVLEYIGYAASVLVAISLMMSAIVKLRVINLVGSSIFSAYGFMIGALPVGFLNLFIALVDIYYLIEIFSAKEYFQILEMKPGSEYIKYFCGFHSKEIDKFQPAFKFPTDENVLSLFILRNSVPAGLVIATPHGKDEMFVNLDYAIPGYRDFKMGGYVIDKVFKTKKIKRILSNPGNTDHQKYLKRIGYNKVTVDSEEVFALDIA